MEAGHFIGPYQLEERIAQGGMGAVWRARHPNLDRLVAIKVIRADLTGETEVLRQAFLREVRLLSKLHSPHTLQVTDSGFAGDVPYMVTEYLEGETLRARMRRETVLSVVEATAIAVDVLSSLSEAHALGLVHRDLKPSNIFLQRVPGTRDAVKVLDFGLAKLLDGSAEASLFPGAIVGSPRYMSPEQIKGATVTPASDLYAFGGLLYHMLTGKPPFSGGKQEVMLAHLEQPVLPPSQRLASADISLSLDRLVLQCLEKSPSARPESADALRLKLQPIQVAAGPILPAQITRPDATDTDFMTMPAAPPLVQAPPVVVVPQFSARFHPAPRPSFSLGDPIATGAEFAPSDDEVLRLGLPAGSGNPVPNLSLQATLQAMASIKAQLGVAQSGRPVKVDTTALLGPAPTVDRDEPEPVLSIIGDGADLEVPKSVNMAAGAKPFSALETGDIQLQLKTPPPVRAARTMAAASLSGGPSLATSARVQPRSAFPGYLALFGLVVALFIGWMMRAQLVRALGVDRAELEVQIQTLMVPGAGESASGQEPLRRRPEPRRPNPVAPSAEYKFVEVKVSPTGANFTRVDTREVICTNTFVCTVPIDVDIDVSARGFRTERLSGDDLYDRRGARWRVTLSKR